MEKWDGVQRTALSRERFRARARAFRAADDQTAPKVQPSVAAISGVIPGGCHSA